MTFQQIKNVSCLYFSIPANKAFSDISHQRLFIKKKEKESSDKDSQSKFKELLSLFYISGNKAQLLCQFVGKKSSGMTPKRIIRSILWLFSVSKD